MIRLNLNTKKNLTIGVMVLAISVFIYAFTSAENETEKQESGMAALPVEVAKPIYESITEWDEYTGRFEASSRVEVRARVSGFLEKVNFQDGELVKKGQTLF